MQAFYNNYIFQKYILSIHEVVLLEKQAHEYQFFLAFSNCLLAYCDYSLPVCAYLGQTSNNTYGGLDHDYCCFWFRSIRCIFFNKNTSPLLLINIHVANIIPKIAFILIVFLNCTSDSFAYRMFIRSRLWSAIQSIWINNPISSVVINTTPLMRPFIVIYMLIIKA